MSVALVADPEVTRSPRSHNLFCDKRVPLDDAPLPLIHSDDAEVRQQHSPATVRGVIGTVNEGNQLGRSDLSEFHARKPRVRSKRLAGRLVDERIVW